MKIPTRSPCLGCEASLNDMAVQIPMQLQPLDFSKVWCLKKNGCLVKSRGSEAVLAFPVAGCLMYLAKFLAISMFDQLWLKCFSEFLRVHAMHRFKSWESFTRSFKVTQADQLHDARFYFFVMTVERNPSSFRHFIDRIRKKSFPKDDMEDCYDYGAVSGEVRASRRCCMMNFSSPPGYHRRGVRVRVCPSYTVSL